jgi:hypothetical protein
MAVDDLREFIHREPFESFRVRVTSGDAYEVRDPDLVVLMRSRLFIAFPRSDRSVHVPYLHIAAVESLANGHGTVRRRRKRG